MGVARAFKFLEGRYQPEEIQPHHLQGQLQVDFSSILLGYTATTLKSMRINNWMRPRQKQQPLSAIITKLVRILITQLPPFITKNNCCIHFDGSHTQEKALAHEERLKAFQDNHKDHLATVNQELDLITTALTRQSTLPMSSTQRSRIVRHSKKAVSAYKAIRSFSLDPGITSMIADAFEDAGWIVHRCAGEADTCISGSGNSTVVSADSDFLFRGAQVLLRKDPQLHAKYTAYVVDDLLESLGLSRAAWTVVGVVSGNDYASNFDQVGITTNYNFIRSLHSPPDLDARSILRIYCTAHAESQDQGLGLVAHFQAAQDIFVDNKETLSSDTALRRDTNELDRNILHTFGQVGDALQRYRAARLAVPSTPSSSTVQSAAPDMTDHPSTRRGYKKMMSGNSFKAKACNIVQGEHGAQAQEKKKRKIKRKTSRRKRRRALYNASSRADRAAAAAISGTSSENVANTNTDTGAIVASTSTLQRSRVNHTKSAQIAMNCLEQKCGIVSLGAGTLKTRLREGLREHNLCPIQEVPGQVKIITDVISEMVRVGTEITRCAEMACALYIAETTAEFPSLTDPDHIKRRKVELAQFASHNGVFFGNLFSSIFAWYTPQAAGRPRADNEENRRIDRILSRYEACLQQNGLQFPRIGSALQTGLAPFLRQASERFADTVQVHFKTHISELVERVGEDNPVWVQCDEGKSVIDGIDENGVSKTHDTVSLFWILNSHLPPHRQIKFFPGGGFKDQFFTITEAHLVMALMRTGYEDSSFLARLFRTQAEALTYVASHPGELFAMFLTSKMDFTKRTRLASPGSGVITHSLQPYFEFDFEEAVDVENMEDAECNRDRGRELRDNVLNATGSEAIKAAKDEYKSFIYDQIKDPASRKAALDSGEDKRRYVLRPSLTTNGPVLYLSALSMAVPPPPKTKTKRKRTTRSIMPNVLDVLGSPQKVQEVFGGDSRRVVVGIDPGIHSTMTGCILDSALPLRPKNLTITQGSHSATSRSYLRGLEQAKQKAGIGPLEQSIQPVECPVAQAASQGAAWVSLRKSIKRHIVSVIRVEARLRAFYRTPMFKIKAFHKKQALQAITNKGLDNLISGAGVHGHCEPGTQRPLFVIGDGEFGGGGEVLYKKFIELLRKKLNALGVSLVWADEYLTSQICCQCKALGTLQGRELVCSSCGIRDRDHNGSHNIARATLHCAEHQQWPAELSRPQQEPHQENSQQM